MSSPGGIGKNVVGAWFLDYDDNTLIQLSLISGSMAYSQKINPTKTVCSPNEVGSTPTTGVPSDAESAAGSISRFSDRLSVFFEELTPSRMGGSPSVLSPNLGPFKSVLTRYDFINVSTLGTSDGSPNQTYVASGISLPTTGTPFVFVGGLSGGEKWTTQVTSFVTTTITVTPVVDGTTTWGYRITGVNSNGKETIASLEGVTTTGAATLSLGPHISIVWSTIPGAVSYNIYRTTASGTPKSVGKIGNVAGNIFSDTGIVATGRVPSDKAFTYDAASGQVKFGDGTHGIIPQSGKELVLRISIRNGGGRWVFNSVLVNPGIAGTVGSLKSVRDKVIYAKGSISLADFAHVASVTSTINSKEQSITCPELGVVLETHREWSFDYGGQIVAIAGGATTINASVGFPFTPATPQVPINGHGTTIPAPGDTAHPLLNVLHGAFTVSQSGSTVIAAPFGSVVESSGFGISTSGDAIINVSFIPIQYVHEIQTFGFLRRKAAFSSPIFEGSCDPNHYEFVPNPQYLLYWSVWNAPLHTQSVFHNGWNSILLTHTGIDDLSDDDIPFSPNNLIDGPGFVGSPTSVRPISNGRENRLISIGDIVGNYSSPVRDVADQNTSFASCTAFLNGSFHRSVLGSTTRHPEWITMAWEGRITDASAIAYLTYVFGLVPGPVTCIFTAIEGTPTILPDSPVHIASPGPCPHPHPPLDIPHGGQLLKFPSSLGACP